MAGFFYWRRRVTTRSVTVLGDSQRWMEASGRYFGDASGTAWMHRVSREDRAREGRMIQAMRGKDKGKKNKFIRMEQKVRSLASNLNPLVFHMGALRCAKGVYK
jgi:hypothetical protein